MISERLDALIDALLNGTATPADESELESLLAKSPEARRRLVEQSTLDGLLQDALKQSTPRVLRRRGLPWSWIAAAAAVLLFAVIVARNRTSTVEPERAIVRRHAEEKVQTIQKLEEEATRERDKAATKHDEAELREWESKIRELQEHRRQAERELAEVKQPVKDPPRPAESIPPTPQPPVTTEVSIARIEGDAFVVTAAGRTDARDLLAGNGVETDTGTATLTFSDGIRVQLAASTSIREITTQALSLWRGTIDVHMLREPYAFRTPHAEATVIVATLRLVVTPESTTLEVTDGAAKFTRDRKTVDVKGGQLVVATAKSLSAVQPIPKEEVLLSLDFEDKLPALVQSGTLEKGPNNRSCLAGIGDGGVRKVTISAGAGALFTVRGDEVLTFDYWADATTTKVNGNVLDRTQGRTHEAVVPKLVTGKWTRVTLRLADFGTASAHPNEGDVIANLYLQGIGDRFYIDNLQFTRPRKEK